MYDERVRTRYLRSVSVWDVGTFAEPGFDDRSITSLTRTGSRNMHLCLCPSVLAVQSRKSGLVRAPERMRSPRLSMPVRVHMLPPTCLPWRSCLPLQFIPPCPPLYISC